MSKPIRLIGAAAAVLVVAVVGYELSSRFSGPGTPTAAPTSTAPTTSSTPRPFHPGEATFTSTIHGIVTDYPAGWQVRPATEAWTGGQLSFNSPAADVIFDPAFGAGLYLILASQPNAGDTAAARLRVEQLQCSATGSEPGGSVDGYQAFWARACPSSQVVTVRTESRAYVIELVVSSENPPSFADTYSGWLTSLLDTADLRPQDAFGGPSPLDKPFAQGSFSSHGGDFELDALGTGPAIRGRLTMAADGGHATMELECTGTTVEGFTAIAGMVISSTSMDYAPVDSRIALAFKRGSPIEAIVHIQGTDIQAASCAAFIDTILDAATVMEPIEGTLRLAP